VNNRSILAIPTRGTHWAFLLFFLTFFSGSVAVGQRVGHLFVSKTDTAGTLYYIYSIDGFKGETGRMDFDLTRHSTWEHFVVRFTLLEKERSEVDSLRLVCGALRATVPVRRLFVERKGARWKQRYEAEVDADLLTRWTQCPVADGVPRFSPVASRSTALDFRPGRGAWKRLSGQLRVIMDLIELNKPG